MSFDRGNLNPRRHNVAWKSRVNAANFAADVAGLCLQRFPSSDAELDLTLAVDFLALSRQLASRNCTFTRCTVDRAAAVHWLQVVRPLHDQFDAWSEQLKSQPARALHRVIDTAYDLYFRDDKKTPAIANNAGRWVYTWALYTNAIAEAEIEQLEIRHRIADRVTPPSDNCRQAFEAVWALGKFRDAIKLLHRKER